MNGAGDPTDDNGYKLFIFILRYQENFLSAQLIRVLIKFDGVVLDGAVAHAFILTNELLSNSNDGQKQFDLVEIQITIENTIMNTSKKKDIKISVKTQINTPVKTKTNTSAKTKMNTTIKTSILWLNLFMYFRSSSTDFNASLLTFPNYISRHSFLIRCLSTCFLYSPSPHEQL